MIDACSRKHTASADSPTLLLDHSELSGLGDLIASLGDAVKAPTGTTGNSAGPKAGENPLGSGCSCRQAGGAASHGAAPLLALIALLGVAAGRRAVSKCAMMPRHDSCPVRAPGTAASSSSFSRC